MNKSNISIQLNADDDLRGFTSLNIFNGDNKFTINSNQIPGLAFLLVEVLKEMEKKQKIVDENDIELLPWREQLMKIIK